VPVEKWKTGFIKAMIKLARPQALWITCGKTRCLWKKTDIKILFLIFHRLFFALPVEMWKTLFKYCG
jgi:hypothetical protein